MEHRYLKKYCWYFCFIYLFICLFVCVFVTPVVELWLEREIAQWVHSMKGRSDDPSHHERTLFPWSYISLLRMQKVKTIFVHETTERMIIILARNLTNGSEPFFYIFILFLKSLKTRQNHFRISANRMIIFGKGYASK